MELKGSARIGSGSALDERVVAIRAERAVAIRAERVVELQAVAVGLGPLHAAQLLAVSSPLSNSILVVPTDVGAYPMSV